MRALSMPVNDLQKKQTLIYKSDIFNFPNAEVLGGEGGLKHFSKKPEVIVKFSICVFPNSICKIQ